MPETRPNSDIIILVDVDGIISENNRGQYKTAPPVQIGIDNVNKLYNEGYTVHLCTARYSVRHPEEQYQYGYLELLDWLKKYGVKFHKLFFHKKSADIYIDDKGVRVDVNDRENGWENVWQEVAKLNKKNQYGEYLGKQTV